MVPSKYPPRLHQWHKLENAYTKNFFGFFTRTRVNGPPPCACQWTPPFERRNMAPLANGPPLSKEETRPGPLTRVGDGSSMACALGLLMKEQVQGGGGPRDDIWNDVSAAFGVMACSVHNRGAWRATLLA